MSNKTFISIVVLILVVFALIYIPTSSTQEISNEESITTETTTQQIVKINDVTESESTTSDRKTKIGISDVTKRKRSIRTVTPSITERETTKKKISINIDDDSEITTKSRKKVISIDVSQENTTASGNVRIKVFWSSEDHKEKGCCSTTIQPDTLITEDVVRQCLINNGYTLVQIEKGQEYIGEQSSNTKYEFSVIAAQNTD